MTEDPHDRPGLPGNLPSESERRSPLDNLPTDGRPLSAEDLQRLTSVAPVLLYIYDLDESRNVWLNDALPLILGYRPDEIRALGSTVLAELLHPDDMLRYPEHLERLRKLSMDDETAVFEYRMRHKNGSWVWLVSHERAFLRRGGVVCQIAGAAQDATARKLADERLEATLEQLPVAVGLADFDGQFVVSNSRMRSISVPRIPSRDGARGWRWKVRNDRGEPVPPDQWPAARALRGETVQPGVECTFTRDDGREVWMSVSSAPLRAADGSVQGAIVVIEDIDERKRAQLALKASEERFRAFLTASSEVIYQMNADWTEMRHLRGMDLIADTSDPSRTWLEKYIHPDDQQAVIAAIQEAICKKGVFELEHRVLRADGSLGWKHSRAIPLFDDRGEIVEWFGAARDVTERRTAEEALRVRTEELEAILDVAPVPVWISADAECLAIRGNRLANQLYGVAPGTNISPRAAEHERVAIRYFRAGRELAPEELPMQQAASTGQAQVDQELQALTPDGRTITLFGSAVPLRDPNGSVRGVVAAMMDTTMRKQVEDELRRANSDLEQFAYSASHDLQEPLRTVKIFSELISTRCRDQLGSQGLDFLNHVLRGAARMDSLLHDLLAYTRAGKVDRPTEPHDANAAFKVVLENLRGVIDETHAEIRSDLLPTLPVDTAHLQQLFQNLVGNAIKYRRAGVPPLVHIVAEPEHSYWRFAVSDNGIGIEPAYKDQIFGLFKRLHSHEHYPGTGIGLALCQRIVEQYGGRIWVESEPGLGSTFYFTLPASISPTTELQGGREV